MQTIAFTVIGEPVTKGSVTAFVPKRADGSFATRPDGSPLVVKTDDTGRRGKAAAMTLANAALAARVEADAARYLTEALAVTLAFVHVRPRSHYGTGRNAQTVKGSAPAYPAKRPDVDKLTRHVLDACKGVLYNDDGQIVRLTVIEDYGDPARTEVTVAPLAQQTVAELLQPQLLAA
jgi:Holliday junction resolvase RusA-like endonuclease